MVGVSLRTQDLLLMSSAAEVPMGEIVRLLDEEGVPVDGELALPPAADLLAGYRALVLARRLNEQASALVRQGRLAVYPSSHGQEACQVAPSTVLDTQDWLFPTYRDTAAIAARGVDPVEVLMMLRGDRHCGYDPTVHRVAPQATRWPPSSCTPSASGTRPGSRARAASSWPCAATAPPARATSTRH
jgi:hypothetical protein